MGNEGLTQDWAYKESLLLEFYDVLIHLSRQAGRVGRIAFRVSR